MNTVPYDFSTDYCQGFFDLADCPAKNFNEARRDFCHNLIMLLRKLHVESAEPIAECLFTRMSDPILSYHTPIHILAGLQFARKNKIPLAWWEEVAFWFHDAVYVPGNGVGANEWASSKFMEAMLGPYIKNDKLTKISMMIHYTGSSLATNVPSVYHVLLDLDLCNFLFDNPGEEMALYCVLKEYAPYYGNDDNKTGRACMSVLTSLLSSGAIYRSKIFEPFQEKAIAQILKFLKFMGRALEMPVLTGTPNPSDPPLSGADVEDVYLGVP